MLKTSNENVEMSEAPLHLKIRRSIQDRIVNGDWPPQFQLPSEPELAQQFNVSRMTVRQAIQTLAEKGFLYRRRGVGTFVSPVRMERDLSRLTSFSEDALAHGLSARSEVRSVRVQNASPQVAQQLKLDTQEERVIRVERLRFYGYTPVALQTLHVPERLCPELADPEVAAESIYVYFEQCRNYRLRWGVQSIEARITDSEEKALLGMPEISALLIVRRTTFLDDGTPIELSETSYRGDKQIYAITLQR